MSTISKWMAMTMPLLAQQNEMYCDGVPRSSSARPKDPRYEEIHAKVSQELIEKAKAKRERKAKR